MMHQRSRSNKKAEINKQEFYLSVLVERVPQGALGKLLLSNRGGIISFESFKISYESCHFDSSSQRVRLISQELKRDKTNFRQVICTAADALNVS